MTNNGFVYKWTNSVNGKWYIGSHRGNPDDGYISSSKILEQAMSKYGMEQFTRAILYTGTLYREIEGQMLTEADAASCSESYNLKNAAAGGNGGANKGQTRSNLTKQKISRANKGNNMGDNNPAKRLEVREKISKANTGKTLSAETRKKLSVANEGKDKGLTLAERYGQEEANKRIARMTGEQNPAKREDVRQKISEQHRRRPLLTCPHCSKQSKGAAAMYRWHYDNCKHR